MKALMVALVLAFGAMAPLAAPRAQQNADDIGDPAENQAARPAALAFLRVIDEGRYAESWNLAGDLLHGTLTRQEWIDAVANARAGVGALQGRELIAVRHMAKIEDGPAGNYYLVFYHSHYGGKDWQERVVFNLVGKAYKVEGYFIVPADANGMTAK